MARLNFVQFIFLAIVYAGITGKSPATAEVMKGAYWFEQPLLPPSAIETSLFSHLYYAFVMPNNVTFKLEISNSTATSISNFIDSLHSKDPTIKTLLSIGGGDSDSLVFSTMASNSSTRKIFIDSTIEVARNFGFDGLDLDWEYPQNPKEMNDLDLLLKEWRLAINLDATTSGRPPLLLSAAVYFAVEFFLSNTSRSYPVASMNQNMDWINVMSYDLHGAWSNNTGAPAGLFDPKSNVTVIYGIQSWIGAGALPEKVIMGIPLYGRTWTLKDTSVHGMGAQAVGAGPGNGTLQFFQVEQFNNDTGATVAYDVNTVSAYSYSGTSWIGYDDPLTVTAKIGFAQALGLRGYFFWACGFDAFNSNWKVARQGKILFLSPCINNFLSSVHCELTHKSEVTLVKK
ncbi:hypothetical protein L6164_028801 [Bauhinia variegata]|uniref:Uncharacterized protein n=1 Tax=Bauhinia variegata TaxID=167791 RepID=A0ACB9L7E0_BAUVA|nr:hypothetical protein L6164_028801 [Bauhinia variegata]